MARAKKEQLPRFKYATVADRKYKLLWRERIELFWAWDDTVTFWLPEQCVIRAEDEVWLTCGFEERLVRVVAVESGEGYRKRVEAVPEDLHSCLYFR